MPAVISCLTNSYGRFGAQAALSRLPEIGIEYIELPIRTAGTRSMFGDEPLLTHESQHADLQRVEKLLDAHQMRVSSCNITSGNPLQADMVEITCRKLDLASHFDISLVVGGAGEVEDDADLPRLYDHLRRIGDHAGRRGLTYCFETHPGICVNHHSMLRTMEDLQHPHLKLNFDTANILYYNEHVNGEVALAKVCQHVKHLHLKDSQGEYQRWYFPALGEGGAVDFVRVLQLMRPLGFQGPYSLEIEGISGEGELSLDEYHQRIARSVGYLRNCGYFD